MLPNPCRDPSSCLRSTYEEANPAGDVVRQVYECVARRADLQLEASVRRSRRGLEGLKKGSQTGVDFFKVFAFTVYDVVLLIAVDTLEVRWVPSTLEAVFEASKHDRDS